MKLMAYFNPARAAAVACMETFVDIVSRESAIEIHKDDGRHMIDAIEHNADLIVSFGGDGTMLRAAGRYIGTPILGVNLGNLGFMAEYPSDMPEEVLRTLLEKDYVIERRSMLKAMFAGVEQVAVNDVVIQKASNTSMVTVQVEVDGLPVADYRADSLIVSSATGSTGYSLSSGGPIVAPAAKAVCLTPVAPHTMTLRPLVIQDSAEIKVTNITEVGTAEIVCDGRHIGVLKHGEHMYISKASTDFKLVRPSNRSYFELLKKKLLWSQSATNELNGAKHVG